MARDATLAFGPTPLIATALIQLSRGGIGAVSVFVAVAALCTTASVFVAGHSGDAAPADDVAANLAVEQGARGLG